VADFNSDGKPDLAVVNTDSGTVTVLLNTFPDPLPPLPAAASPLLPPGAPPPVMAVAFKRNGMAGIRVLDATTGTVRAVLAPFRGFRGRLRLRLQDLNGDGALDLVVRAVIKGKRKQKVFDGVTLAPLARLA
jgi:hypothetical protein